MAFDSSFPDFILFEFCFWGFQNKCIAYACGKPACGYRGSQLLNSRAAVLIPLHKEDIGCAEEYSIRNTLAVMSSHDVWVICPERMNRFVTEFRKVEKMDFEIACFPDYCFADITGYNSMMMSLEFYLRFEAYEYLLITQTDTLVFSDRLDRWCDRSFSYIGAPWFKGHTRPRQPLKFAGVGNGGFSLRKVSDAIKVLESTRFPAPRAGHVALELDERFRLAGLLLHCIVMSPSLPFISLKINEDLYWGAVVPQRYDWYFVPEPEDAVDFAFEAAPEYLYELNGRRLPFGCHAWERYNPQFWRDRAKDIGMELP